MSADVQRHPFKCLLGGLLLGISLSILAQAFGLVVVASTTAVGIIAVGIVLGIVAAYALPAKRPKAAAHPS